MWVHSGASGGSSTGYSVESIDRKPVDTGWAVFTDKNLYFIGGTHKSFRLPYSKIVSFEFRENDNCIAFARDSVSSKEQYLELDNLFDSRFAVELVKSLSNYRRKP
jgi:hypothetical protein